MKKSNTIIGTTLALALSAVSTISAFADDKPNQSFAPQSSARGLFQKFSAPRLTIPNMSQRPQAPKASDLVCYPPVKTERKPVPMS